MDAIAKIRNARADKAVMEELGQNWMIQQQVDIAKSMAQNNGTASIGAGIGMGLAAGGQFFGMGQQVMGGQLQGQQPYSSPTPPPPPPMAQFYLFINNQQVGPVNMQTLPQYVSSRTTHAGNACVEGRDATMGGRKHRSGVAAAVRRTCTTRATSTANRMTSVSI